MVEMDPVVKEKERNIVRQYSFISVFFLNYLIKFLGLESNEIDFWTSSRW